MRDNFSTNNSISNRGSINIFNNNSSQTISRFNSNLNCFSSFFLNCSSCCSLNPRGRTTSTVNPTTTSKGCGVVFGSCSGSLNNFSSTPISIPSIPNNRCKTSLWINVQSSRCLCHGFGVVSSCINNLCFKSCLIYPVIRRWSKFKSSLPETNQERSNTFCSCSKSLL